MKVILILFLILFVIVSSLFITTFFSRSAPSDGDMELIAEVPLEEENLSIVSDIDPATADEAQSLDDSLPDSEPGAEADAAEEDASSEEMPVEEEIPEEEILEEEEITEIGQQDDSQDTDWQSPADDQSDPGQDTIKIYLDGDMENGIYLGAASYGIDSSAANELYGPELASTGFDFKWDSTGLGLEPGSTHFLYIYYYNTEAGWDYIREKIHITGQKPGDSGIRIFIDEPVEQKTIDVLAGINGWALDSASADNTGIKKVAAYLDGPEGFGRHLGDAEYGLERSGVVGFFNNENYLHSGFELSIEDPDLEPGSKHTLFIYARGPGENGSYNFEMIDIYISGEKEEKSVIEATVSLEDPGTNNMVSIEGYAITVDAIDDFLQKQKEESAADEAAAELPDENGGTDGSGEYSMKKIVFKTNRDGNDNIYSVNLDGSDWQRLTDHNGADIYPEASPDGMKIAYTSDINGIWQIVIMDWDGQNKRQLTNNNFRSAYPTWSHDMRYIYFEAYLDGDWELYRINSNGSGQIRLTHNSGGHDWHPNAHPFDPKIIFESGMPGHDDIYIMNNDGTSPSRMFTNHARRRTPHLSSDSTKLTYTRYFGDNSEVYYTDIRDQNEIRVTSNSDWDGHPRFSPDGSLIVYEEKSGGKYDIIIFNIAAGTKINITNSNFSNIDACFMYQK